jgi:hypothetical protein
LSNENPTEMLLRGEIEPGDLPMWVGYGGKDEFNLDAQIESFIYVAREKGFDLTVCYDPKGHHDIPTARRMIPVMLNWLAPRIAPYAPPSECLPTPVSPDSAPSGPSPATPD